MLVAAGFKTITPRTPAQQQKLQQLQTGQVVTIQKNGRTYYIVADPHQNLVYVGGPHEYQAYQQMRAQSSLHKRTSKLLRCIRTQPCSGMHGVAGELAGDEWVME